MQKEIRQVDEARGIVRVTTSDERWYTKEGQNSGTGLPEIEWRPSATHVIAVGGPASARLTRWTADMGFDVAQAIKREAGARGSKIHLAIADVLRGTVLTGKECYWNDVKEGAEPLTFSEWGAVWSFIRWLEDDCPFEVKDSEFVAWPDGEGFATTIDLDLLALRTHETGRGGTKRVVEAGERFPCDLKSSQNTWYSHLLQVGGAHRIAMKSRSSALLQVGYEGNKRGTLFSLTEDYSEEFRAALTQFRRLAAGEAPLQRDYPLTLSLKNPPLRTKE